ncbi:MAG: aspartate--tRNA ligase [Thermoleophilaceae bacterium]|nr:aspartate--tRNA ligase [Thermoleophilaceae bacterium]
MREPRPNRYRTGWAGDQRAEGVGRELRVAGWVHRRRDHGGLIFIDLRDRTGLLQLVFRPEENPEAHAVAHTLRSEDVISAVGQLVRREEGTVNPGLPTGEVELNVRAVEKLADAETPPFPVDEDGQLDEMLRLRHRYLDLRRERMRRNIELRHEIVAAIRSRLDPLGFLEIETPFLTRSTPEGARDFLVPSRLEPGSFFALPQSPQLFKQLLMVGGLERYYQIVRCFRDEDARADRLPEFTQLDIEMSFVEEDDVLEVAEAVTQAMLAAGGVSIELPLERVPYDEAMLRYGSDRPDRRIGMEIHDLGEVFAGSGFRVFADALASGKAVRGFAARGELTRRRFDELTEQARRLGAGGLVWAVVEEGGWRSPVAKFLSPQEMEAAARAVGAERGDAILIVADTPATTARVLGQLRLELAPAAVEGHDVFWVVDFPMLEWNEDEGRWDALHHPFTAPVGDLDSDPGTWRSRAYDIVWNGNEIGGGSIRINMPEVQERVFDALGIPPEEARERFGFLLDAFRYGAPPHGGIAFGIDRIVALCAGEDSIRDVIAFPKLASGFDPLTGAPAPVDEPQLRELGLRLAAAPGARARGEEAPAPQHPEETGTAERR